MESKMQKKISKDNETEFNPNVIAEKDGEISLNFENFEFDDKEILEIHDKCTECDEFFSEKEYQILLEEYLNVKNSNINVIYSNPLYFIKKIIYFYNKETFFKPFMLILKSPKDTSKNKADEKAKSISIQVNIDKDKGNASLNLNLDTKIIDATINPDNKNVTLSLILRTHLLISL